MIKKRFKFILLITSIFSLFSCANTKCTEINSAEGKGEKVLISMIDCYSSEIVFELEVKLNFIKDSLTNTKTINIATENISLKKSKNFNYLVDVIRLSKDFYSLSIAISKGNKISISGMNPNDKVLPNYSRKRVIKGSLYTFSFTGTVREKNGNFYSVIEADSSNIRAIKGFNKDYTNYLKNYTIELSIHQ